MTNRRPVNAKIYTRAVVAILLIATIIVSTISGILVWLAPSGQRSGQQLLLFNLTKSEWNEIHFWVSIAFIAVAIIHIIVDWKVLRAVMRYITSTHREPAITPK